MTAPPIDISLILQIDSVSGTSQFVMSQDLESDSDFSSDSDSESDFDESEDEFDI